MRLCSALVAFSLAIPVCAQSQTLVVDPAGLGLTYTNPGANFFDLNVTNAAGITLQALTVELNSPANTVGELKVFVKTGTHIGSEQLPANWTQISDGTIVAGVNTLSCQNATTVTAGIPSIFLPQGTYGVAVEYVGVNHVFDAVVGYPLPPFVDANVAVSNGSTQSFAWTAAPLVNFTFGGVAYPGTMMRFDLIYAVGQTPHACAICGVVGEGSNISSASTYQLFGEPNPNGTANAALQGKVLSFLPNGAGTGYIMTDGTGTVSFVPPNGLETNLPLVDNQDVAITTLLPLQYPGDTGVQFTNDLIINSNGYVSVGPTAQTGFASAPRDAQAIMQAIDAAWYCFHDFDNSEAGSGNISYYEDLAATTLYVTWNAVECVPNTVANTCTIQFQFDLSSGAVHIVFDVIDAVGGSTVSGGDNFLIGWSPAGVSPRTDAFDFATLAATPIALTQPEVLPLTLATVGPPLLGGSFDLITTNPPTPSIGVLLINTTQLPAPLDLGLFGAPAGTLIYLDAGTSFISTVSNIPGVGSMALTFQVPTLAGLAGQSVSSQVFWLDLAAAPFPFQNVVASNMVVCTIGNF